MHSLALYAYYGRTYAVQYSFEHGKIYWITLIYSLERPAESCSGRHVLQGDMNRVQCLKLIRVQDRDRYFIAGQLSNRREIRMLGYLVLSLLYLSYF